MIKKICFWVQNVIPLTYSDSLSYYEEICRLINYINGIIDDIKDIISTIEDLQRQIDELKNGGD